MWEVCSLLGWKEEEVSKIVGGEERLCVDRLCYL